MRWKFNINKLIVVIPCAGYGSRFLSDIPKQYHFINNKTILEHTISKFITIPNITQIIVTVNSNDKYITQYLSQEILQKIDIRYLGANSRMETVLNTILSLGNIDENTWIMVHDAVRCCISTQLIKAQIKELADNRIGGILAIPVNDTLKQTYLKNGQYYIQNNIKRDMVYLSQTPQMFRLHLLKYHLPYVLSMPEYAKIITDEASIFESLNLPIKILQGSKLNIKITTPDDLIIARLIINASL